jgi:excisionase family DNA binding protein
MVLTDTTGYEMQDNPRSVTLSSDRLAFGVLDLAQQLGVSPAFVRLERARGKLSALKLGRRVIFTREAVAAWLERAAEQEAR